MTDRTKTICPPIFDQGGKKIIDIGLCVIMNLPVISAVADTDLKFKKRKNNLVQT
jgi:hypothetical protein